MIINNIADIVKQMIIDLYSSGIHFYQIIIALFILNFLIYQIGNFLIQAKKCRRYKIW